MPRNSPPSTNQDYGSHISPPPTATGGGGITTITSADGSVTVTNPTGPTTDLSAGGKRNVAIWLS